ncbi:MAG: hypothetical protein J0L66_01340 [Cytophagales bacterium]|nr:hypothetical protein [Cytophagales bacterium]
MPKKVMFLLVALLLPGLIFLFLKKFGKNEFSIPVYYQTEAPVAPAGDCGTYSFPYRIADSIKAQIFSGANPKPVLVVADTSAVLVKHVTHVAQQLNSLFVVKYGADTRWLSCAFFLNPPWTAVLIDTEGQIRGYYAPTTREEADRLLVELKILLKQY